jgi:hypothetical protein
MYYWFRPAIHICESPDADRAICGATVTGYVADDPAAPRGR